MAEADDTRRVALALPGVVEMDSAGFDFGVGVKGFVWSCPECRSGKPRLIRTDVAVLFVGDEAERQALLLGEPKVFFTAPGYDSSPLVLLRRWRSRGLARPWCWLHLQSRVTRRPLLSTGRARLTEASS